MAMRRGKVLASERCYTHLDDDIGKPEYVMEGKTAKWNRDRDVPLPRFLTFTDPEIQDRHDEYFKLGEYTEEEEEEEQAQSAAAPQSDQSLALDKLLHATVASLDPRDSQLWTKSGMPSLSAIKDSMRRVGYPDTEWVTRKEVNRIVGEDFTQESAAASSRATGGE